MFNKIDENTTLASEEVSVDPMEEIASLLAGDESQDSDDEETPSNESTTEEGESEDEADSDEDEGSEKEEDSEKDTEEEAGGQETEATWESVLGVDESKLDIDDDGVVKGVKVKVDGEVSTIPVPDLIAGYQTGKSVTQRSQRLAEERKSFDGEKVKVEQAYKQKLDDVSALSGHLEKQLVAEFNGVDWDELRAKDPAEYAALRQDYTSRATELQQIKTAIASDQMKQATAYRDTAINQRKAFVKEQFDLMIEKNPQWADEAVRKADMAGYKAFLSENYGFTEDEFKQVVDSRLIELMKDARRFHEGLKLAKKKVVKKVPKFQKSKGKSVKRKVTKLDKLTKDASKASGAKRRDLQSSAVAELLKR